MILLVKGEPLGRERVKGGRGRLVREGCRVEELKQLCYYLSDLTDVSCYYYCCLVVKFKNIALILYGAIQ